METDVEKEPKKRSGEECSDEQGQVATKCGNCAVVVITDTNDGYLARVQPRRLAVMM